MYMISSPGSGRLFEGRSYIFDVGAERGELIERGSSDSDSDSDTYISTGLQKSNIILIKAAFLHTKL